MSTHVRILCPKAYLVRISCPNPRRRLRTTAPPDSALRLDLRPGKWVLWEGRVHRLDSLRGVGARIQGTGSADLREIVVTELRGLPSLPTVQLDRCLEKLRIIDTPAWNKAHQREAIILDALQGDGSTTTRVDTAAKILGVSARTVRRLIIAATQPPRRPQSHPAPVRSEERLSTARPGTRTNHR